MSKNVGSLLDAIWYGRIKYVLLAHFEFVMCCRSTTISQLDCFLLIRLKYYLFVLRIPVFFVQKKLFIFCLPRLIAFEQVAFSSRDVSMDFVFAQ